MATVSYTERLLENIEKDFEKELRQKEQSFRLETDQLKAKVSKETLKAKNFFKEAAETFMTNLEKEGLTALPKGREELQAKLNEGNKNIQSAVKTVSEKCFDHTSKLKKMKVYFKRRIEEAKKSYFTLMICSELRSRSQQIDINKSQVAKVATKLRQEQQIFLQGFDTELNFLIEGEAGLKQKTIAQLQVIRDVLKEVLPAEERENHDWKDEPINLPTILQSLLELEKRIPVEVSTILHFLQV